MTTPTKLMMVEDSSSLATIYRAYLSNEPYDLVCVETLGRAHATLDAFEPDIVLLDIELPDGNGMDFLDYVMELPRPPVVIVMTAHGTSDMAVRAIDMGALDFLTKPFDRARLRVTLANAAEKLSLGRQVDALAHRQRGTFGSFIGASSAMQSVYETIEALAPTDATGFIVGESGTGKEFAAEAIHSFSRRSAGHVRKSTPTASRSSTANK